MSGSEARAIVLRWAPGGNPQPAGAPSLRVAAELRRQLSPAADITPKMLAAGLCQFQT
jgi:hypothetical protein